MSVFGYKAMNQDMSCRGFKYEIGKTYHMDEPLVICERGFHFCRNACDVFHYYEHRKSIVFEIEALGKVVTQGDKSCTDCIRIVRRLHPVEEARLRYGHGVGYSHGYGDGTGYGTGYGNGHGDGYGDGYGDGRGDGNGNGYGYGYGDGHGCGGGDGYGDGYGGGAGAGYSNISKVLEWEE